MFKSVFVRVMLISAFALAAFAVHDAEGAVFFKKLGKKFKKTFKGGGQ